MLQLLLFAAAVLVVVKGMTAVRNARLAISSQRQTTGATAKIVGVVLAYCGAGLGAWSLFGLPMLIERDFEAIADTSTAALFLIAALVGGLCAFVICPNDRTAAACLVPAVGIAVALVLYLLASLAAPAFGALELTADPTTVLRIVLVAFMGLLLPLLATNLHRYRGDSAAMADPEQQACPQCGREVSVHTAICPKCETRILRESSTS